MSSLGYLEGETGASFDLVEHLAQIDRRVGGNLQRLLATADGRRTLTRLDPLLFAVVYCPMLLRSPATGDQITWADTHLAFCRHALSWLRPAGPREARHAFVAPRESAKSSWLFKLAPLWAAAHQHLPFIAAFSSSGRQAEAHLAGFKHQLDTNELLRHDYPDLCTPARRPAGTNVADRQTMYYSKSGFAFAARGLDAEILGLVDPQNRRPLLVVLDDVEPDESNYSEYQMRQRLTTIVDTVLPMNERAHVVLSGTVTMPGSIVHQLVKTITMPGDAPADWVPAEGFRVHYFPPIVTEDDGTQRSVWPAKWPLDYLRSISHTRSYAKNFMNDPRGNDGDFWTSDDYRYGQLEVVTRCGLWIDPPVTSKRTSDYAGMAVVAFSATEQRCMVSWARQYRLTGAALREKALDVLAEHPEVTMLLVEVNQGGDLWVEVFHDMPVPVKTFTVSEKKEVRAGWALTHYQAGRVLHAERLPELEQQQTSFPKGLHDDLVDTVSNAAIGYLGKPASEQRQPSRPRQRRVSYV